MVLHIFRYTFKNPSFNPMAKQPAPSVDTILDCWSEYCRAGRVLASVD